MIKKALGDWLKEKRIEAKLSKKEFATLVGCHQSAISRIECKTPIEYKSCGEIYAYQPGEALMASIAAQFEKTLNDVYDETDYKDRTVRKRGFGYTHPNTPKTKSDSFSKKSMDNPIHKAPISDISFDSSLPPIKFFVLREKSLKINNIICEKVIVKTCDSKEFAMGYINGANNRTEENVEFKVYQGYLMEVEIER
jgi:DNA-binding XRE family transcriptional regulator